MKLVYQTTVLASLINAALGMPAEYDDIDKDFDYSYENDDSGPGTDYTGISSVSIKNSRHGGASSVHKMVRDLICGKLHDTGIPGCSERPSHVKDMLRNYGCSCYPYQSDGPPTQIDDRVASYNVGKHGKPLDELDKACSELADMYNCVTQDGDNGVMAPFSEGHRHLHFSTCGWYTTFTFHISDEGEIVCGPSSNPEYVDGVSEERECRWAVCQIERKFSYKVFEIVGKDISDYVDGHIDNYFAIDKGMCHKEGTGLTPDDCCGSYPDRFPYSTAAKECCADGVARLFGDCS